MSKTTKKIITAVLVLVIIACLGVILTYVIKNLRAQKTYKELQSAVQESSEAGEPQLVSEPEAEISSPDIISDIVSEEPVEIPVDFEALWEHNEDVIAWIQIPGTVIDYPVMQSSSDAEEDYYLDHTYEHESGYPGSIYIQRLNNGDFTDTNTVLYGHNMKDGSMFAGLHKYENADYWEDHSIVYIYTPEHILTYQVFAAVTYSDILILKSYDFTDEDEVQAFIDSLSSQRNMSDLVDDEVEVTPKDRMITLSTCIGSKPNNRLIVEAVLIDEQ